MGRTSGKPFIAAGARISIENPHVSGSQYSAARIKLRNGPDSVEVGWRVSLNFFPLLNLCSPQIRSWKG